MKRLSSVTYVTLMGVLLGIGCGSKDTTSGTGDMSRPRVDMSTLGLDMSPVPDAAITDASVEEEMERDLSGIGIDMSEPRAASGLADAPSVMGHFQPNRQAAVEIQGPRPGQTPQVDIKDFAEVSGEAIGTSPWHVFSDTRYKTPSTRTLWGASLKYVYKFVVDRDRFEFADAFKLNAIASSIPWNLVSLSGGRVLVPDSNGFREDTSSPCYGEVASLLLFGDDEQGTGDPESKIVCKKKFELSPDLLRPVCGVDTGARMLLVSGVSTQVAPGGEIITTVAFQSNGVKRTYMVVLDNELEQVEACGFIADTQISNEAPLEEISSSQSALYYPSQKAIVKMVYDSDAKRVTRQWERTVPIRERTGTTPTLVDTPDGERFVVIVDAPCATSNLLNGLIVCQDDSPAKLLALRRQDDLMGQPELVTGTLPPGIQTVENSPAAHEGTVVVANYSGYLPNGLLVPAGGEPPKGGIATWGTSPDSVADFARGLVAMTWDASSQEFKVSWSTDLQVSGVPTISIGSNMVYGTGADEKDGNLYLYGFRFKTDEQGPGGEVLIQSVLGTAPFRQAVKDASGQVVFNRRDYALTKGELYDAGNNLVVGDNQDLFLAAGSSLVRIK